MIKQGVEIWNSWRQEQPEVKPDLREAQLMEVSLKGANLSETDFRGASLRGADLRRSKLWQADLREADLRGTNLSEVDLGKADLRGANISQADLRGADLRGADLRRALFLRVDFSQAKLSKADFRKAQLSEANLYQANLSESDFSKANLSQTNLSKANLCQANLCEAFLNGSKLITTQALNTNLEKTKLTGACIEAWEINEQTNLKNSVCDYIYLKYDLEKETKQERLPKTGKFAPGEFSKLFEKPLHEVEESSHDLEANNPQSFEVELIPDGEYFIDALETIDLIFSQELDWHAIAYSFAKIQAKNQANPLIIQSIKNKGDGVVVIRASLHPTLNKTKIQNSFMQDYELAYKVLNQQAEEQSVDKDKHINQLLELINKSQDNLAEIQNLTAETSPINTTVNDTAAIAGEEQELNIQEVVEIQPEQQIAQHNYTTEQMQTLAKTAVEIQQFLTQLQAQGYSLEDAQQKLASDWATQAKLNPTVKTKLENLRQYLNNATAQSILGEPALKVINWARELSGILLR
ncbi:MAG: pentapeptide repeat-containing protein [Symploca sp. SIO1C4]|uniref:Pentapeptide repeat-containing protein n=1 Tax=Symploca sp. SIO1C4 TaxID=2607765 RepID=A0A6B3N7C0_9CYAN|nr:pentapeptide repeat-containing protein [Symploca sp. SIO1C4]NET03915.1 pentapeptide repeat-containing protein [Symploca sp. SIO2B6]